MLWRNGRRCRRVKLAGPWRAQHISLEAAQDSNQNRNDNGRSDENQIIFHDALRYESKVSYQNATQY